jgi:hypothetical protein
MTTIGVFCSRCGNLFIDEAFFVCRWFEKAKFKGIGRKIVELPYAIPAFLSVWVLLLPKHWQK